LNPLQSTEDSTALHCTAPHKHCCRAKIERGKKKKKKKGAGVQATRGKS
jgi:hypothetical protein